MAFAYSEQQRLILAAEKFATAFESIARSLAAIAITQQNKGVRDVQK